MSSQTVLCHLKDWQGIPVVQCLSLQKEKDAKECFGCDACSRKCAKCRSARPVCPEVDLCEQCLKEALAKEGFLAEDPLVRVYDWKICVGCMKRQVYYNVYGLCLHCSAKEFIGLPRQIRKDYEPQKKPRVFSDDEVSVLARSDDEDEAVFSPNGDLEVLITDLTDVEQIVMTLYHRESYSASKIGQLLQLSEGMVLQIYAKAVGKIRESQEFKP